MVYLNLWEKHWTLFYNTLSERGYTLPQRYNPANDSPSEPGPRIDLDPTTTEHLYRYMVRAHQYIPLCHYSNSDRTWTLGCSQTYNCSNTT